MSSGLGLKLGRCIDFKACATTNVKNNKCATANTRFLGGLGMTMWGENDKRERMTNGRE
jgi:hypothetical protein